MGGETIAEVRDAGGLLRLEFLERLPPGNPGAGDLHLDVSVESNGFAGRRAVWIDARSWQRFVVELRELEGRRQGDATLGAMSLEQFELKVCSIDRAGHMGVFGRLARHTTDTGHAYCNSFEFGFTFCPTLLPAFARDCESIASP